MRLPPILPNENQRLSVLDELAFSSAPLEPSLEGLVELTRTLFDAPMVAVNIVQAKDVNLAASVGMLRPLDEELCRRDISFCAHTIAQDEPLIVPDAQLDPRFHDNPLVTGAPHFRFYAGITLRSSENEELGALCIIDDKPRTGLEPQEIDALKAIAEQVAERLDLRRMHVAHCTAPDRFEKMAASSSQAILSLNEQLQITMWNRRAEEMFGYVQTQIIGSSAAILFPDMHKADFMGVLQTVAGQPDAFPSGQTVDLTAVRRDGNPFAIEASVSVWNDTCGTQFAIVLRDLTDIRGKEAELYRLLHSDPVTGLPNRAALKQKLEHAFENEHPLGLILLDIDGFKHLNGILGADIGDQLLVAAVRRLEACLRPEDGIFRTGADEFALYLDGMGDPMQAAYLAESAIKSLSLPFCLQGQTLHVSASAGVGVVPGHGASPADFLANTGLALEVAQQAGGGSRRLFSPQLRSAAVARRKNEVDLRYAIEDGQFEIFYQPQVDLASDRLIGAEALLRWRHPEWGLMTPDAFLPAVHGALLPVTIGRWTLETACRQTAIWRRTSSDGFRIGVNLFAAQFRTNDLARDIDEILRETALTPDALELEITENIILDHDDVVIPTLARIRDKGVHLAFDDFGTGYACLSHLKRYPLTRLKIDRSFVKNICEEPEDEALVDAILYLGRRFNMEVIAEGVETLSQRDALLKLGCLQGQGYLFGRPLPAAEFEARYLSGRARLRRRSS